MPRNPALPLSDDERRSTIGLAKDIAAHKGPVVLTYVKRDGKGGRAEGTFDSFVGKAGFDTFSANIVTADRGIRTINLCRVKTLVLS